VRLRHAEVGQQEGDRRRTKVQGSFSNEAAVVTLLYGLVAFGQIRLRKIDGYQYLAKVVERMQNQVA
jgi:hypothetical protein